MLQPWRIKIYDTDDVLQYTLTDEIIEASFTDEMTTDVGNFSFTVPAMQGFTNSYDDVGNFYKCTFEISTGSGYVHLFSGRVGDFSTELSDNAVRTFTGKGLGELLERRVKRDKRWQNEHAIDIVQDIADDLGLSTDFDPIYTLETITVNTEPYFDILRRVSDYWYNASIQVKRDFGINKDGALFWKARPMRTVGVETITNILAYSLKQAIASSKNNIRVLGAAKAPLPVSMDAWTDSLTDWTATEGTLSLADAAATTPNVPKAGTYWIKCDVDPTSKKGAFARVIPRITTRNINRVRFWYWLSGANASICEVRLFTDDSNYFVSKDGALSKTANVYFADLSAGDGSEYDAAENPTGIWSKTGSPNWYDINSVGFYVYQTIGATDLDFYIDKFNFYPEQWRYDSNAEDSTNQGAYGEREAEYVDSNLLSAAECQSRQETLLYQQKDRVMRLDFAVPGNTNILLGDRLSMTLPLDNLTAQAFDVVSTTHAYKAGDKGGYQTTVRALNTSNTRRLPPLTPLDTIRLNMKQTKDIVSDIYGKIVK
jgi:hypothetical protein